MLFFFYCDPKSLYSLISPIPKGCTPAVPYVFWSVSRLIAACTTVSNTFHQLYFDGSILSSDIHNIGIMQIPIEHQKLVGFEVIETKK